MPSTEDWVAPRPLNLSLLHSFPQLKSLDFSWNWFNHLFDPIHGYKSLQRLEKLRTLDFLGNHFNTSVLPFLSTARSLRTLNLGNNLLIGVFPPNELASMPELRVLSLEWNGFLSFSVQGLINFRELEVLNLSENSINNIEAGDGLSTTKLKTLDLSYNEFAGAAPLEGLEYFVELEVLRLMGSWFQDTRPIQVLKDPPKLQELHLTGNFFTNVESLGFVLPSSLQVLDLQANRLSLTPRGEILPTVHYLSHLNKSVTIWSPSQQNFSMDVLSEQLLFQLISGYSEICRLMHLRELDLSQNALTSMPYCLNNLTRLRTLDLSGNQLNGNLSSFVFGLPSTLEYLSLLVNDFNGSFLFNSLVNHTRLTVFKLSSRVSMIQDQTERSWVPLFQLKMLKLQNFIIGNRIPGFLVQQHDLCFIDISYSHLTGPFPTWLVQNNTKLETMLLNNNSLTKLQLPRQLVHGLQVLDISSNRIHDSVQKDIGIFFPNLKYMKFDSNHFHGTIPSSMSEMKGLQFLDMSSNGLSGQLPITFLSCCYSLKFLKLSNNQLQGKILPEHANLTGLSWLLLDGNNFSGSLGKGLLNSRNLYLIDISNNSFSGTLPRWISRMSSLSYIYMRRNQLKGLLPRQLQNLQQLKVIDISQNSFSGSIPRNVVFPSLIELRLHSNEFMGKIPNTLFEAKELEVLDLRNNNFSGKILNTIGKSSNLRVLLLRNNSLQSHIPKKICQLLSKVGILDLSHNKFKGVIPSCLGNMSFSEPSDFNNYPEYLQGNAYFINITLLQHCDYESAITGLDDDDFRYGNQAKPETTVDFSTKNRYEAYQGSIIRNMHGLDFSSNQLSGEIPVEIGDLKNIRSLNLSSNCLTGSIPDSISKLKDLESLDLSNNKLDGNIPPQLADLNNLGFFNVSCNNLSGEIPIKGHLLTFQEMSYIGNAHLCGPPTNKSCNPTRVLEPNASKQAKEKEDESDGVIDMVWFYWTCGAVYISTSLALFAFLYIDSRWSREWFYRGRSLGSSSSTLKGSLQLIPLPA